MRIGIDIMGGDYAPQKTVHGAILALNELPKDTTVVLFGKASQILAELKQHSVRPDKFEIIDCSEVIDMGEHPTKAFKSKPNSSIAKGFKYLALGKIDGFSSAGNTGAMFVGGFYSVKAIEGILRPVISTLIPRNDGGVTVLLDVGANADYHFTGNIEGRDIFDSESDVIVCDGFTGNIVLKEAEGIFSIMEKRGLLDDYFKRFNYEKYGGTPILGLNKTVIIGHGISNEIAIKNMITLTKDVVEADLASKIKHNLN